MARVCWFAGSLCFLFDNDRNSILSFWHSLSNQPVNPHNGSIVKNDHYFLNDLLFCLFINLFILLIYLFIFKCNICKMDPLTVFLYILYITFFLLINLYIYMIVS